MSGTLGPRGTQTSAGRREALAGLDGSGSGGRSSSMGSRGIKRPGFLQNRSKVGSVISGRMDDVSNKVMTGSPPHPQARAWSPHLSMTCPQSDQLVSRDQMGIRRRRRRLTRKSWEGM